MLLAVCLVLLGAADSYAVGKRVLVLPFQAVAGPEMPNASRAIPEQIISQLKARNFEVVPMSQSEQLLRSSKTPTIDLARARAMGQEAAADLVIYGSFNQLGQGFSMETRLVPVHEGSPLPVGFERNSLVALNECTSALASRVQDVLNVGKSASQPKAQSRIGVQDFVPMGKMNPALGGIQDIQIRGMNVMDPDTVLMRLTIRKGDTPDANAINEEVKRVWEMGYFSDACGLSV